MNILGIILKLRSKDSIAVLVLIAQAVLKKDKTTTTNEQTTKTQTNNKTTHPYPYFPRSGQKKFSPTGRLKISLSVKSTAYALP